MKRLGSVLSGVAMIVAMMFPVLVVTAHGQSNGMVRRTGFSEAPSSRMPVRHPHSERTSTIEEYIVDDFEGGTFPPTGWPLANPDGGITWDSISVSSYGVGWISSFVACFNYPAVGAFDSLLSPVITGLNPEDSIWVDYAYTDRNATFTNDSLIVAVSTNGGASFTSLWREGGANLKTAPSTTTFFIPAPGQWATKRLQLPVGVFENNVVVAFICRNNSGNNLYIDNVRIGYSGVLNADDNDSRLPAAFTLSQNYPNPFNPTTRIEFALPEASSIRLRVYNILGQEVVTLASEQRPAGYHSIEWNGRDASGRTLSSGIYFYKLEATATSGAASFNTMKKMLLVK